MELDGAKEARLLLGAPVAQDRILFKSQLGDDLCPRHDSCAAPTFYTVDSLTLSKGQKAKPIPYDIHIYELASRILTIGEFMLKTYALSLPSQKDPAR